MRSIVFILLCPSFLLAGDSLIPKNAKVEKLWGDGEFTEWPAYGPVPVIYFSDIGNRIMKFDERTGKTT